VAVEAEPTGVETGQGDVRTEDGCGAKRFQEMPSSVPEDNSRLGGNAGASQ